ncbi:MAG: four helix bundle protein, partial [Planctomycetales bacterium 12-60-4]
QRTIGFSDQVYRATQQFPPEERFGLTNQLRRSAVSIAANIAEGSGRGSPKEFVRFVAIAYGSLMESVSHLRIARNQNFLTENDYVCLYEEAVEIARMLSGLRISLEKKISPFA